MDNNTDTNPETTTNLNVDAALKDATDFLAHHYGAAEPEPDWLGAHTADTPAVRAAHRLQIFPSAPNAMAFYKAIVAEYGQ